ncbi:gluconokinase [Arthrobacter sp. JSM 101049]|uniref:gluconokinase n=1 Tax=Arthrobacter sp. JSM 101049 TaxID=929097 RepID=UPI00356A2FBA
MPLPAPPAPAIHLVVMGVSGSGKTSVASHLATQLGWPCAEADDFHPPANIAKMAAGTPLDDADRRPWLEVLRDWMDRHAPTSAGTVVTCSALKQSYRDLLGQASGVVRFLHIQADPDLLARRLEARAGHFMPGALLASQLATLEPLGPDEDGVTLLNDTTPADLAERAIAALGLVPAATTTSSAPQPRPENP